MAKTVKELGALEVSLSGGEAVKERNERYNAYVKAVSPTSAMAKSLFHSFWVGGVTCVLAQIIFEVIAAAFPTLGAEMHGTLTLCAVIFIAVVLTGVGVFDKIGRFAGAGAFLPITGFANAMASSAMEYRTEGLVLGSETKFFSVVGPVLVNGVVWSAAAGLIRLAVFSIWGL
ncbi:MAG: SpoVA/SpoVAEb family sporulation membrane protein [Firmicutes bacterium]|nr:SpoVA/SpoVAEb family sporulation membrane protein [Bacillota bacterium]